MKSVKALAVSLVVAATPAAAQVTVNPSTIGARVIVNSTSDVIATFMFSDARNSNDLTLTGQNGVIFSNKTSQVGDTVNLGSFAIGTELIFGLTSFSADPQVGDHTFYTGYASRNPDGIAHAAVSSSGGTSFVGFEDKFGGGDRDYNDLWFSFTGTSGAVPEPASWAMMIGGFGLVGGAVRRRNVIRRATVSFT